jgi:hypothetical protein
LEKIGSLESDLAGFGRTPAHRFLLKALEMLGFSGALDCSGEYFEIWRW